MTQTGVMAGFRVMLIAMLFYSFSITLITYAMPNGAKDYVTDFAIDQDFDSVSEEIEGSLTEQTNIPVLEVGALVFYSGNLLVDLLLNFAYAVPQMLGLLVHIMQLLFNLDGYLFAYVEIFAAVCFTALYFVGIIQLLAGIRSGQII